MTFRADQPTPCAPDVTSCESHRQGRARSMPCVWVFAGFLFVSLVAVGLRSSPDLGAEEGDRASGDATPVMKEEPVFQMLRRQTAASWGYGAQNGPATWGIEFPTCRCVRACVRVYVCVRMRVRVRACARACSRACARACARARVRAHVHLRAEARRNHRRRLSPQAMRAMS
jgi:hypothetical protein